ncbi:hypothetical protein [Staphylococcus hominis]|uniref:hypothetical protein n=1 Tax=Staphylococcus hominis TaxID=1290 RepID=UPI001F58B9C8|nr:hypothetical protein [Staphylococcus hominis]MCI2864583.1 hypothetical protein [Staphylococcus hominis]MDS3871852.1 hypothetical protein [Staphylococcus hominis]
MNLSIKELEDKQEISKHYNIVFDNTLTMEDFDSEDEFIEAYQESARIELNEYADHEYIEL